MVYEYRARERLAAPLPPLLIVVMVKVQASGISAVSELLLGSPVEPTRRRLYRKGQTPCGELFQIYWGSGDEVI